MSDKITFSLDGKEITASAGQTIMQAADEAGVYIPRLCAMKDLLPIGSCRVCVVKVNGRYQASCTQPVEAGAKVENETKEIIERRKQIVEMLFVEGNHFCMFCEKSGDCELQAVAYKLGILGERYPFLWPERDVDMSHKDIMVDHNRCILCGRCVSASAQMDDKGVFEFIGRGHERKIAVNSEGLLKDTKAELTDRAMDACPVGCIVKKRVGFAVPVGQRTYDKKPIGSDVEGA